MLKSQSSLRRWTTGGSLRTSELECLTPPPHSFPICVGVVFITNPGSDQNSELGSAYKKARSLETVTETKQKYKLIDSVFLFFFIFPDSCCLRKIFWSKCRRSLETFWGYFFLLLKKGNLRILTCKKRKKKSLATVVGIAVRGECFLIGNNFDPFNCT